MNAKKCRLWMLILMVMSILTVPISAQTDTHSVMYDNIRFSFPSSLATGIQAETIEAFPITQPDEQFLYAHYPEHIRFGLLNYLDGSEFRLPYLIEEPQILVYSTDSMRDFGYDFVDQPNALQALLQDRPDLSTYVGVSEIRLPFLPWINSGQMLRSHPQYVEIAGVGSGIRYVTRHSQEADHLTDKQIFYTFQGIMADGAYYVSAILPVKTGVLPEEVDTSDIDWDEFGANYSEYYLPETFMRIDSLPDEAFNPSLTTLDTLIQSVTFETEMMSWPTYTDITAGYSFQYPPDRQICALENSMELIFSPRYFDEPDADHCSLVYQSNPISIIFSMDDDVFQAFRAENYPNSFVDYQEETIRIVGQSVTRISGKEVETGSLFELFRFEYNDSFLIFRAMGEENISILNAIISTIRLLSDKING